MSAFVLALLMFARYDVPYWAKWPNEIGVELMLLAAPSERLTYRILDQEEAVLAHAECMVCADKWPPEIIPAIKESFIGWHELAVAHSRSAFADNRLRSYYQARKRIIGY